MKIFTLHYNAPAGWSASFPGVDGPNTMVVAFGATGYFDDPAPVIELASAYPQAAVIGCSTSGEIHGTQILDDTIVVVVVEFDSTRVRAAQAPIAGGHESSTAGRDIATQLDAPDLAAVFVLSDGLNVNGTELVDGINGVLAPSVVVTGGLAGDKDRFIRTWVIADGEPRSGYVTAIGLYGSAVRVGHGSRGGWDIFGPERRVTRSEGNVLFELDGRPALRLYQEYLGDLAEGLPATGLLFPLALRGADSNRQLVRTLLAVDEEAQSITFAGDIPQGAWAQLMRANFDRVIGGAEHAALMAGDGATTSSELLAIAVSCVGRRLVLGQRTEEEVEATLQYLPIGTTQVGFYSYGELSPHVGGTCDLHNQTMTLTTIYEAG